MPKPLAFTVDSISARVTESASLGRVKIWADASHPNKLMFKGILVRLDEPSTKPPQGAQGHLIMVPTEAAKQHLQSLVGMGVNYAENLDSHDPAFKVGVIEKAWIKGNALWVSGYVWVGDFPDAEKVLSTPGMGMSMELTRVMVEDRDADVWVLKNFVFTGATFLRKSSAAYFDTEAIAAAADITTIFLNTEAAMPKPNKNNQPTGRGKKSLTAEQKESARIVAAAASVSITRSLGPVLASVVKAIETSNTTNAAILERLEAADMEEDDLETEGVDGAGKKSKSGEPGDENDDQGDDFDDQDDPEDDDDEDEDEVDTNALESADSKGTDPDEGEDDEPGHLNPDAEETNDGELEEEQGPTVAAPNTLKSARLKAAKMKKIAKSWKTRALKSSAENKRLRAESAELRTRTGAQAGRISAGAAEVTRKTMSAEALGLLSKNGLDAADLKASGQKLTVDEVDALFANCSRPVDMETRIDIKLQLKAAGIMFDPAQSGTASTVRRSR